VRVRIGRENPQHVPRETATSQYQMSVVMCTLSGCGGGYRGREDTESSGLCLCGEDFWVCKGQARSLGVQRTGKKDLW